MCSGNKPHRENKEGNRQKKDLRYGVEQAAEKALFIYVSFKLDSSKNAVTGSEDAKEEAAQSIQKVITNFTKGHVVVLSKTP